MGYIDLIPDVFRLTMPDLTTGSTYRTTKFNVGNKSCIGVTIKASQTLSVAVAYGIVSDTAAAAGGSASLPYKTSATSFASSTGTEAGTYHEIAIPPHARQAQLVISNASGSTVSGAVIDAALRVVAYPAASSGGSSAFGDITGWPGASTDFIRGDGSDGPLSATDIPSSPCVAGNSGTSVISLSSGAVNIIAFNSDAIANSAMHDPTGVAQANSRFIAPYTGRYRIKLCIALNSTVATYLYPFKNGGSSYSTPLRFFGPYLITLPSPLVAEMTVQLSANDYIEWGVNPASAASYYPSSFTTYFGRTFAEFEYLGA